MSNVGREMANAKIGREKFALWCTLSVNIRNEHIIWGIVLQVQGVCFNDFPDQCVACTEYTETRNDLSSQLMWMIGTGTGYMPPYMNKVVKECKRYHKRKVEYLR